MRAAIQSLPGSKIREVANAGLGRSDVLAFWFGESDEVTPEPIRQAAADALMRGETFYSHNLGLPELRQAIATYASGLHGPVDVDRIAVTSSGVTALMLAMQLLAGAGDEVVAVVPVWPNLTAQPVILGAHVTRVPLRPKNGLWQLDMDELLARVTPRTRVLLVNAPNNPTGWTLTRAEQQALLAHCRRTGTWIVADEVYERVYFGGTPAAPSFLDVATPDDRLIVAQSFSKSFLMTGWRLGWLVVPEQLTPVLERLAQNLFICASTVAQQAALACFEPESLAEYERRRAEFKARRDYFIPALNELGLTVPVAPDGAFYAWADCTAVCQTLGIKDSWDFAFAALEHAHVAITPGRDFGTDQTARFVRFSTANSMAELQIAIARLKAWLQP